MTHTPGQWLLEGIDDIYVRSEGGLYIAEIINVDGEEDKANARLIAASPDLLDALKDAAATFRYYERIHRAKATDDGEAKAEINAYEEEHAMASRELKAAQEARDKAGVAAAQQRMPVPCLPQLPLAVFQASRKLMSQ